MKQTRFILSLILLAMFMLTQVSFAESKGKDKADKLAGWHAHTAKELKLTDEQVEKYKAIIATQAQWKKEHGEAYNQARKALKAAKASGDKKAYQDAKKELKAAQAGKGAINKEASKSLDEILTPDQKNIKAGMGLYNVATWGLKKAKLTREQKTTIREMAYAKGAELTALKGKDRKAASKIKNDFKQQVASQVLTDEQRAIFAAEISAHYKKTKAQKSEKKEKKNKKHKVDKGD